MDTWKYYDITHRRHAVCNPSTPEKLDEICGLLDLRRGSRVLDIACGKAELLIRLASRYGIKGVGVDLSPFFIEQAREACQRRAPHADLELIHLDGAKYRATEPFDVAICLGASWIWKGFRGTLRALARFAAPGGLVVSGEPFWIREPSEEHLVAAEMARDDFSTHLGNVAIAAEEGLTTVYAAVSSLEDWDRYEGLQWHAASEYARSSPDDPDLPDLMQRVEKSRDAYLRYGRDEFGWAIYVLRKS